MIPDGSYTAESLLKFLKQAGMEGLINPAAARSRRNAVEQLHSELTESERRDVRTLDVDELASRFHKLEGSSIRTEALALYVERFKMALADFLAWMDHPETFSGIGGEGQRAVRRRSDGRSAISAEQAAAERITLEATENPSSVVPVPLRPTSVVYLANLPLDLTRAEADRIARVVQAFAVDSGNEDGNDGTEESR